MLNKLLEDGNTLYRKNRFEEAAHRYGYAVRRIPIIPMMRGKSEQPTSSSNDRNQMNSKNADPNKIEVDYDGLGASLADGNHLALSDTFVQLKIHLLLNLSRCQRRLGKHTTKHYKCCILAQFMICNLTLCQRLLIVTHCTILFHVLGDWELASNSASDAVNEIGSQRSYRQQSIKSSSFMSILLSSELAAYQARAKAKKENGQLEEAAEDLTLALGISPNSREIHKMLIRVKEEIRAKATNTDKIVLENNNNEFQKSRLNNDEEKVPIGANAGKHFKYVDDSASQKSEVSSVIYKSSRV